ncbi:MAG: hypothetical protein ACOYJD_08945 [Christensenellales bacterium]|jgi:hypothetical protein
MKRLAYIIRIITVAPLMALVMLLILRFNRPDLIGAPIDFYLLITFLVVFPLLGYPLQPLIKIFKDRGREGQRTLAIYFAVAGYVLGCVSAAITSATAAVWLIYLSYLLSGLVILIFNKVFHLKASGHACGVVGPFAILCYFGQVAASIGMFLLGLIWASSIYMKRHTHLQLLGGSLIPILALGFIILLLPV